MPDVSELKPEEGDKEEEEGEEGEEGEEREEGEEGEDEEGEDEAEEEIPVAATEEKALLKLRLSLWAADKELLSERISSVVSERGNDATI